jgi:hypothetical protein
MTDCSQRSPYPGLRPFREDESDLFFGREEHVTLLKSKLETNRFVAVVGISGSGKSSLVRAGLIADLKSPTDFRSTSDSSSGEIATRWRVAQMQPRGNPITELGRALIKSSALGPEREALFADIPPEKRDSALKGDAVYIAATLRRGPPGLADVLSETPLPLHHSLLIFVDQFEEIFRFREKGPSSALADDVLGLTDSAARERWANEAEAFVNLLLKTASYENLRIHILLTMRLDYLSDCAVFFGLPEAINSSQFLTPRLNREQRAASIVAPARLCGGDVAPDLVNALLNDTGPESDQLPLLQHCLMRMWTIAQESQGAGGAACLLTMEHYLDDRVGTLKDCLKNHANEICRRIEKNDPRSHKLIETVFRCLTERVVDGRDMRRPQPWALLLAVPKARGASEEDVRRVVDAFRHPDCNFLMPELAAELTDATPIDISHESLIRHWDELKNWVDDEARSADTYRRLEREAREWKNGGDPLSPARLATINLWQKDFQPTEAWSRRYGQAFPLAMEYLEASREKVRRDKEEAEERLRTQANEKLQAELARQMRAWQTALAIILIIVALLIALVFYQRGKMAEMRADGLRSLRLADKASRFFSDKTQDSFALPLVVTDLEFVKEISGKHGHNFQVPITTLVVLYSMIAATEPGTTQSPADFIPALISPDGNTCITIEDGNRPVVRDQEFIEQYSLEPVPNLNIKKIGLSQDLNWFAVEGTRVGDKTPIPVVAKWALGRSEYEPRFELILNNDIETVLSVAAHHGIPSRSLYIKKVPGQENGRVNRSYEHIAAMVSPNRQTYIMIDPGNRPIVMNALFNKLYSLESVPNIKIKRIGFSRDSGRFAIEGTMTTTNNEVVVVWELCPPEQPCSEPMKPEIREHSSLEAVLDVQDFDRGELTTSYYVKTCPTSENGGVFRSYKQIRDEWLVKALQYARPLNAFQKSVLPSIVSRDDGGKTNDFPSERVMLATELVYRNREKARKILEEAADELSLPIPNLDQFLTSANESARKTYIAWGDDVALAGLNPSPNAPSDGSDKGSKDFRAKAMSFYRKAREMSPKEVDFDAEKRFQALIWFTEGNRQRAKGNRTVAEVLYTQAKRDAPDFFTHLVPKEEADKSIAPPNASNSGT